MPLDTPPGRAYLFTFFLPNLLTPPILVQALRVYLQRTHNYHLSLSWVFLSLLLWMPTRHIAGYWLWTLYINFEARRLGAQLIPIERGRLPGNLDILLVALRAMKNRKDYFGEHLQRLTAVKGKTFRLATFWREGAFTIKPEYIKIILTSEDAAHNYIKGQEFHDASESLLGNGIFNADGDMWKFHRGLARPFFSRDRVSDFDIFDKHATEAIDKLSERLRAGLAVDFQDLASRFTLDSATAFLLGARVHSLAYPLPYPHNAQDNVPTSPTSPTTPTATSSKASAQAEDAFATAFTTALKSLMVRFNFPLWQLGEIFEDRLRAPMMVIDNVLDPLLDRTIERMRERKKIGEDEGEAMTLLDSLAAQTADKKIMHDQALNVLLAGRDTTACTLTYATYMLAMHPKVLARAREEVLSQVGPSQRPSFEDIRDMKYLRAVINETLRLFPPVPFNSRRSLKATIWPALVPGEKPFYIPAGTSCGYGVFFMHRDKDLWGPDAEEYDPDRFLDDRKAQLVANPFMFLPFNAGPRICLGQQFAYNEVSFLLIRLLQRFDQISLAPEAQRPESLPPKDWALAPEGTRKREEQVRLDVHLTLFVQDGLWVKMREAREDTAVDA